MSFTMRVVRNSTVLLSLIIVALSLLSPRSSLTQDLPNPDTPLKVGGDVSPPTVISSPDPEYTDRALRDSVEGEVVVWAVVRADGSVGDAKVVKKLGSGLDESAVAAVRRWRFSPAMKDAKPVAVQVNVRVRFKLRTDSGELGERALPISSAPAAQKSQSDIAAVVAAGKIEGDVYSNSYLHIILSAPKAKLTAPSFVNFSGKRARLVQAIYDSGNGALNYTIAVLADSLENYPKGMPIGVYVRSVRHQLEKEGLVTVREEFPTMISGVPFSGAFLKSPEKSDGAYLRGLFSTFLSGYVLSFDVQGRDEQRINETLSSVVKIVATADARVRQ
jgi:protein TonB